MNSGKYNHSLVVVKNKLFVISKREDDCEVFDNICKNFISIKSPKFISISIISAFSIENKIYAFQDLSSKIHSYDINRNEWSEDSCEVIKNTYHFF